MAQPDPSPKAALEALRLVMLSARLDRDCMRSQVLEDPDVPGTIIYLEEWSTEEAVARRVAADQFATLLALMETASSRPSLEFRVVTQVRGLEFVEAVRSRAGRTLP
jgi:quinol monooxygenase YgiN